MRKRTAVPSPSGHPPAIRIEMWDIDRIIPYARNPRLNDNAIDQMAASIREYGFTIPVLARSDGELIDGHLRLKAARKLDLTQVPVIVCDSWTPAQVKAFRIQVNKSATWASFDIEMLKLEFDDLREDDFDLSLTGFNQAERDALLEDAKGMKEDLMDPSDDGTSSKDASDWLKWSNKQIPLAPEELAGLNRRLGEYIEREGVNYGFVRNLLGLAG